MELTYENIFGDKLYIFQNLLIHNSNENIMKNIFYQPATELYVSSNVIKKDIYDTIIKYNLPQDKLAGPSAERVYLPDELIYIYLHSNDLNNDLYVNHKHILNFNCAGKMSEKHTDYFDISIEYDGQGYCYVYSWHKRLKKYVIRSDGGGNHYDREANYNLYTNEYIFPEDQIIGDFHDFLNHINN